MSQKLIGFLIHFSNLNDYECWLICRNMNVLLKYNLQRITAESKSLAKTRRNQPNSRIEVATEK